MMTKVSFARGEKLGEEIVADNENNLCRIMELE